MASSNCILNVAIDYWYPKGQERLVNSLERIGYKDDVLTWTNKFPNDNYDSSNLYNCKASAFEEALKLGYKNILWLDCSVWAIGDLKPIFDIIERDGYFFIDNGYNCAQTCSDACLDYYRITRDVAETYKEVASGIFGLNVHSSIGEKFIEGFIKGCKEGACNGSRIHDGQSQDKRFLFHRQDQSVASIVLNRMNLKPNNVWGELVEYNSDNTTKDHVLTLRGM